VPKKSTSPPDGAAVLKAVLKLAAPRPKTGDKSTVQIKYAVRFANAMGEHLARDLDERLPGITATPQRTAKSAGGKPKQLDVNYSTTATGLALGISLKSVHIREKGGRYTHNYKRNEEELRIEALGYHKRQPYAAMIGVLFLPFDSCDDGKVGASSFGGWVRHLRPYAARSGPRDDEDRFEKIYIALYEPDGTDLRFFDVELSPPQRGRPRLKGSTRDPTGRLWRALTYAEFLDAIYHLFLQRNNADFRWDDGTEEPLEPEGTRDLELITGSDDEDT
jgi:hypothetical protein